MHRRGGEARSATDGVSKSVSVKPSGENFGSMGLALQSLGLNAPNKPEYAQAPRNNNMPEMKANGLINFTQKQVGKQDYLSRLESKKD